MFLYLLALWPVIGHMAYTDVKERVIHNHDITIILILSLSMAFINHTLILGIFYGLIVFTLAYILWYFADMGAGDSKLLTSLAIYPPAFILLIVNMGFFLGLSIPFTHNKKDEKGLPFALIMLFALIISTGMVFIAPDFVSKFFILG